MKKIAALLLITISGFSQTKPLKFYISVDMEGIGGIGSGAMVTPGGKDYETGRKLMTAEVNAVIRTILDAGPAEIVVNDSHGDMQNLLHTELDPRVEYIQSNIKPVGMVQELDGTFNGVIFIGYHARAGAENGFLAHTGTGNVKGLWINKTEVGEGGLNAFYAGALGVPVLLASGDKTFTEEIVKITPTRTVVTKTAIGASSAKLLHPEVVLKRLREKTAEALKDIRNAKPVNVTNPIEVVLKVDNPARVDVALAIPGMKRVDGYTMAFTAKDMDEAYKVIRLVYKYLSW